MSIYPDLPIFSYKYIVESYHPSRHLKGFLSVFSEFWSAHKDFLPDVFEIHTLYELIDTKWIEYCEFIDTNSIEYRFQLIAHGDENSSKYEEAIESFWRKQTGQSS